jgi:hypothetical protein
MSYPINYPTPQNANVQIFYGSKSGSVNDGSNSQDWVKPQGASFVWFTLIGAGGNGNAVDTGGGSGSVTNFMCPAFLIPDRLTVYVGESYNGSNTQIVYQEKDTAGYQLLAALTGTTTGGSAAGQNAFAAMGFYQSIAGQSGATGSVGASSTTFLSGGGASGTGVTANYGYTIGSTLSKNGFFQTQPIIVGIGGMGLGNGGIGCGGGVSGSGGNGLVVIITW